MFHCQYGLWEQCTPHPCVMALNIPWLSKLTHLIGQKISRFKIKVTWEKWKFKISIVSCSNNFSLSWTKIWIIPLFHFPPFIMHHDCIWPFVIFLLSKKCTFIGFFRDSYLGDSIFLLFREPVNFFSPKKIFRKKS